MPTSELVIGFPDEWNSFRNRHLLFLERFENLQQAFDIAYTRKISAVEPIDRFIMMFGRLCSEDFFEIFVLCGNGYGTAASRLLRSLWEKAVTLEYLDAHPEDLQDFFDYHHVAQKKLYASIREVLGGDAIPPDIVVKNEAEFERVKEKFMITKCETCDTKRLNHTWSKLDIVSMAKRTRVLGKIINEGYYVPMANTHSTIFSLIQRMEETSSGSIGFNPDLQPKNADNTLRVAHLIELEILKTQNGRYKLPGLEEQIEKCEKDWVEIYGAKKDPSEGGKKSD